MSSYQKYFKALALLFPAILMIFILSTSCQTEKEVIKEVEKIVHDTVIVEIEIHDTVTVFVNGAEVDTIMVNPAMVSQGNWVELTASASLTGDQGFTYAWFVSAGELDAAEGDTVHWKTPDEPGVYTVTVHATDGNFIGMGAANVGVDMYVPTATPYFLGDAACSGCHSGKHTEWAETGHAHAWETLQNSGHPAPYCNPCHTVGYEPEANTGNSGYDEAPIEKFVNVQCENCHGAASEHIAGGIPDPTKVEIVWDVMNCGKCHDGTHHPFLTEWLASPHNFDAYAHSSSSCGGCHDGVAAGIRLSGGSAAYPLNQFYGSGAITERPDTADVALQAIVCQACHDPHSDENPSQVRTVDDVVLVATGGVNPVIEAGGTGKLCMQCHHARRGPDDHIPNGNSRFGPHHSPQGDVLAAETGFEGVADPTFQWAGPSHLLVSNSCKTCHLNMSEFGTGPGGAAVVGHEFIPKPAACVNCHGNIESFEDIPAGGDYDGDGVVEGLQLEVDGLFVLLRDQIVATGLDTTNGFVSALGDPNVSTLQQREAGWNWVYAHDDASRGIHNPDYIVQLLQQSYLYMGGTLPNNVVVKSDNEAVAQW